MLHRLLGAVLVAGVVLPVFCQQATVQPLPAVPDWLIYREFLYRVTWLDALADRFAAQGQDDSGPRGLIARQARLTPQQAASLITIAKAWRAQNDAALAAGQSLVKAGLQTVQAAQLQSLHDQLQQAPLDYIAQVQTAFGPAAFKLLDVYIRSNSTVRLGSGQAPPK